jgi:hypothetical protein
MTQSCDDQYTWFQQQLKAVPADDWLIVVGHHPADEMDVHDFVTPMTARGFSLYVNGHAHTLTQYAINGKVPTTATPSLLSLPVLLRNDVCRALHVTAPPAHGDLCGRPRT